MRRCTNHAEKCCNCPTLQGVRNKFADFAASVTHVFHVAFSGAVMLTLELIARYCPSLQLVQHLRALFGLIICQHVCLGCRRHHAGARHCCSLLVYSHCKQRLHCMCFRYDDRNGMRRALTC